jgi:uncharacterized protein YndB with AHSA1/START domain
MKAGVDDLQLTIVREFAAPRTFLWELWTDAEHAKNWWGPRGCSCPVYEADVRPGGVIRIDVLLPDGSICRDVGMYEDVLAPERLTHVVSVEHSGTKLLDIRTTVTFDEFDGNTKVTVRQTYFNITGDVDIPEFGSGASKGWAQILDRLGEYLIKHDGQKQI